MTENVWTRWTLLLVVFLLAGWSIKENWVGDSPLQLGIDLKGGWTITYSVPPQALQELQSQGDSSDEAMNQTVAVISERVDSLGLKEVHVRREGQNRILITAPDLSLKERQDIQDRLTQLGSLEFLIEVGERNPKSRQLKILNPQGNGTTQYAFAEADAIAQRQEAIDAHREKLKAWNDGGRKGPAPEGYRPHEVYTLKSESGADLPIRWIPLTDRDIARRTNKSDAVIREALDKSRNNFLDYDPAVFDGKTAGSWLYADPDFFGPGLPGFTGEDILRPRKSFDNAGQRVVIYEVKRERQADFEEYTGNYVNQPMAIVLNSRVWSAPNIEEALSDNVQIRGGGGGFTEEEQDYMVTCLQSGSLKLRPTMESQIQVGASLGENSVDRGWKASLIGLAFVILFMLFYYRFGGFVATIALVVNLGLLVAMLAFFQATLTLPGIAGVILTIGMAVDANILIFERIREELAKGKTLVAATQQGYGRAFVTIIDANITTLLTAGILYNYGVGPIKGFAVTLMIGILTSLFAGIYLTKTIFATAISKGLIKDLKFKQAVSPDLRYDFLAKRSLAIPVSLGAVLLSLFVFFATADHKKFGIDFTGGAIVRLNTEAAQTPGDVKNSISAFKNEEGKQKYREVEVVGIVDTAEGNGYKTFEVKLPTLSEVTPEVVKGYLKPHFDRLLEGGYSFGSVTHDQANESWTIGIDFPARRAVRATQDLLRDYQDPDRREKILAGFALNATNAAENPQTFKMEATSFALIIPEVSLRGQAVIPDLASALGGMLSKEQAFSKVNYVGPNVVSNLKTQAVVAIILSLIAIILYIWMRFRSLNYGVAAAVAVFHDVIVALGAVVLLNRIGIVHVPLSLSIIAAFLTIIGYSLNDTVVLFDRVRENLGNVKGSYGEVVNISINQTLARTLLTSVTTFIVVAILFIFNVGMESPLEGIAFTLAIGILVGTYSSIFIASPVAIWLTNRQEAKAKKA